MDDYDYNEYEKVILGMLESMWREPEYLEIGENISYLPEVKIIFDGYGDLDGEDEYIEGGDKNMESYAIFIHKDSGQEDFEFPEHEMTPWCLIHRPAEEVCIYAWYDVENDEVDIIPFEDNNSTELDHDFVTNLIFEIENTVASGTRINISSVSFEIKSFRFNQKYSWSINSESVFDFFETSKASCGLDESRL
jgi:hypothetical protein